MLYKTNLQNFLTNPSTSNHKYLFAFIYFSNG